MKCKKIRWLIGIFMLFFFCFINIPSKQTIISNAKEYHLSNSDIDAKASMFIDASLEFGVPASILMALSIHETNLGTEGVAKSWNNWFGIEATSLYPTPKNHTNRYETYPNATASIRDAARLLGSPKASYKITNIIINNNGLDGAYDKIARSITAHWCVNEPGKPCSYDAQALLDTMEQYDLQKYDDALKRLSIEELKEVINKYYGPNAIPIPGYDGVQSGWDGSYVDPDTSNNVANGVYFNTSYTGDVTQGYLYQKYAGKEMWENMLLDSDEAKASEVVRSILVQGEKLYGDGGLHADDFIWNGTDDEVLPFGPEDVTMPGDYANWKQSMWPNIRLGTSKQTIAKAGCLVTSVAIQIARSGVDTIYGQNFDPGTFVTYLNTKGGFKGANFIWDSPSSSSFAPNFKLVASNKQVSTSDIGATLAEEISKGYYVILRVKYGSDQHWVAVYQASSGNNVSIYDPAGTSNNLWSKYKKRNTWTYSLYKKG